MVIEFNVNNQKITRADNNTVVSGSKNYLQAEFRFLTKDWKDIPKTAVFRHGYDVKHVVLDDNNTCLVPWEVIEKDCFFTSIFGGDLVTTNAVRIGVQESGYANGGMPEAPTPDIYTQLLEKIQELQSGEIDSKKLKEAVKNYLEETPCETAYWLDSTTGKTCLVRLENGQFTITQDGA